MKYLISDWIHKRKNLPNGVALYNVEGYDQRHHASPRLHGGLPWSGRIAQVFLLGRISSSQHSTVILTLYQSGNWEIVSSLKFSTSGNVISWLQSTPAFDGLLTRSVHFVGYIMMSRSRLFVNYVLSATWWYLEKKYIEFDKLSEPHFTWCALIYFCVSWLIRTKTELLITLSKKGL